MENLPCPLDNLYYLIIVESLTLVVVHSLALGLVARLAFLVLHGDALTLVGHGALVGVGGLALLLVLRAALLLVLRLTVLALLTAVPGGDLHPLEGTVPGGRGSVQGGGRALVRPGGGPAAHYQKCLGGSDVRNSIRTEGAQWNKIKTTDSLSSN